MIIARVSRSTGLVTKENFLPPFVCAEFAGSGAASAEVSIVAYTHKISNLKNPIGAFTIIQTNVKRKSHRIKRHIQQQQSICFVVGIYGLISISL